MGKKKIKVKRKGKKNIKNKKPSKRWEKYKLEGNKVEKTAKFCPRCGGGVFLSKHKNRLFCGKCHYVEYTQDKKDKK